MFLQDSVVAFGVFGLRSSFSWEVLDLGMHVLVRVKR